MLTRNVGAAITEEGKGECKMDTVDFTYVRNSVMRTERTNRYGMPKFEKPGGEANVCAGWSAVTASAPS